MYGLLLIIALFAFSSSNCNKANKTLVEIGDEKITLGEFEKQYLKTVGNVDSAKNKPMEEKTKFLDLYINFKLKVKDARERGLLNNPEIQKDVEEYKRNFAPTFLVDKEIVETEVEELYNRRKDEVRASHILLNLAEGSTPQDSIAAYQKADSIIQRLDKGEDFGALALEYSQDRTVKMNNGDLYYFTAGMTVPEFEDAVYAMKEGDFTKKPVRTMFGLHIIKLTDRKPRIQSVKISHILIQDKRDSLGNVTDSIGTYNRAMEVYNKAKDGNFESLVQEYSEDAGSKATNGDLGNIERRRLAQPLDSVAFVMRTGDIAGPIRTPYGWHIVKKFSETKVGSLEKEFENIKNEYKKTKNYKDDYAKYVETLKGEYGYKIINEGLSFLKSKFDTLKTIADYNLDSLFSAQDREVVLATYKDGAVKVIDIINHMNVNREFSRMGLTEQTMISMINSSSESQLLNKKAKDVNIESDEEFIASLTDYENGLLVFRVDQDELWSKVKLNENELMSYYESNKSKYTKTDSTGQQVSKTYEEVKPEISNELQQQRYKDSEKAYLDALRQKYPVKIYQEVLSEAFTD